MHEPTCARVARDMSDMGPCTCGNEDHPRDVERDAQRYRYLRDRDLDTIHKGGVFAGLVPRNVVVNGDDLDAAIDAAMSTSDQ